MSHKGKLQRGERWWKQRDIQQNLPDGIKNDPVKIADLDYFLEHQKKNPVKPKEKK